MNTKLPPKQSRIEVGRRRLKLLNHHSDGILSQQTAENLRELLPTLEKEAQEWSLIYSTQINGISTKTLFNLCAKVKSTMVLVIKDTMGDVFGAFMSEPPHLNKVEI